MTADSKLYAVIADDLTGAGDVGVQFASRGLRTRALCESNSPDRALHSQLHGVDVAVVDTASRGFAAVDAYATVFAIAKALAAANARLIYKKLDSTLRGPLGAELDAVLDACRIGSAIVCPAFPAGQRTLHAGILRVNGAPVAETAIGKDPVTPVTVSYLPALLGRQSSRPVYHLPRVEPFGGADAYKSRLLEIDRRGGGLIVCDALEDADLTRLVAIAADCGDRFLLAGSAGLAGPLADRIAATCVRRVLLVCGSQHPVTRGQIEPLRVGAHVVEIDPSIALAGGAEWEAWLAGLTTAMEALEDSTGAVLVTTARADTASAATRGLSPLEATSRLAAALAAVASRIADALMIAGVVATGGDTLAALLSAWHADGVDLRSELASGIPVGRIAGGTYAGLPIVTKAGGFGAPDALVVAAEFLSVAHQKTE